MQLLAFNQTQIQCYPEDHQQALPASADNIPNSFAAGVAELADALDLGSSGETRAGSIPVARIVRRYS